MKHHVVVGRVKTESIADNHKVESIDDANPLRLKVYRKVSKEENSVMYMVRPEVSSLKYFLKMRNDLERNNLLHTEVQTLGYVSK